MNDLFNLNDFRDLDDLLYVFFNRNDLWYFYNSFYNLFDDLFNLNDLRDDSEDLKDFINADQSN